MKQYALLILFVVAALMISGCKARQVPLPEAQGQVEFFDSESFDRQLSSSLRADLPEVTVLFPAAITLNSIPKRLDHWFSKVEEYGGEVQLVPVSDTDKGILSEIMSLLVSVYDYLRDKAIYDPVKEYNAYIYYKKNTGIVTKVVFDRKDDQETAN
ncbi:hypothetical protein [Pseudodesulfovibrio sp. zrk46]|uniref:hypothetical protein n=1 Tax=Pseudodesulfovibrio sp. zrk46 TaxID=2725288 RepID=UPI0014499247|nr:hypothetical protein [Pseudodesulfovibrio sp. zrk46]QJB57054.1 hypothetical protein HFN16_11870 [Pseudodesulfovibrio sp. zrk46]